jgi:outer membrane protein assembly factor BamD
VVIFQKIQSFFLKIFLWMTTFWVTVFCFTLGVGCSSLDKTPETAEKIFSLGEYYEKQERYEEALRRYNEVRQKFPYSSLATQAELKVADVYYKQESYPEAQMTYEAFREQRPQHEQSDYVIFKIAMSLYRQLPSSMDRDLSLAPQALEVFDDLLYHYPGSQYVSEAKEKRQEAHSKLVEKVQYIADFYFKRRAYISALDRYQYLYSMATDPEIQKRALVRGAESAKHLGDLEKQKELENLLKTKFFTETKGGS